ncbi:MAG: Athe_2463 domain-containing protein [Anaerovoracaceae bacterium]|jgi:hypothetical protein
MNRKISFILIFTLFITGILFMYQQEYIYAGSRQILKGAEAMEAANLIEDGEVRAKLIKAIGDGASVTFTFNDSGDVIEYIAVVPERKIAGERKYWRDMTEGDKKAALLLLKSPGSKPYVPFVISVGGTSHSLNETFWYSKGIIVYGKPFGGTSPSGPRYYGYDINGGYYANDDFPRDSDSGRQPWEKKWWTTAEIRQSVEAKNLIGSHALADAFSYGDKYRTAKDFLNANPSWRNHGLDEAYILSHFMFNSVLNDSGLTGGQFIGVQKNAGKLWYQTFSISGAVQMFNITPEEVIRGEIIVWQDPEKGLTDPEPDPEPGTPMEEGKDVEGTPILSLPPFTYEGHPVPAKDNSIYTVDGETWSAYRTMKEGLATNRFAIMESGAGKITKTTSTEAIASFHKEGSYNVRLRIAPKDKAYLYDMKSIIVGKTPTIIHSLTGTKKENRKQTINISVATHPDFPLEEMWVEIENPDRGEKVKLNHKPFNPEDNVKKNSETIKTRAIEPLESDEYFTNCKLDFLTKNNTWENLRYTVYVRDSRGETDQVMEDFEVAPDLPPSAAIDIEKTLIREEGKNITMVEAGDISTADGDQLERKWSVHLPPAGTLPEEMEDGEPTFINIEEVDGFQDLSMEKGRCQLVGFHKEGVGAFAVKLKVKDIWIEETLEEYIDEEDFLTDSITIQSQIVNTAPRVSVRPIASQKAEILMLAATDEDYEASKEAASALKPFLLENAVDGNIKVKRIAPEVSNIQTGANQTPEAVATIKEPFGFEGSWSFLGGGCFAADDHRIYTVQATWPKTGLFDYPESPYIITAYEGATGEVAWSFTITDSLMPVSYQGGWDDDASRLSVDDEGEYLFFRNGFGKTLLLSASNGAYQTIMDFEAGIYNYSVKDAIYSFKDDGIYRISTRGQGIRKVFSGDISGDNAFMHGGRIHFLIKKEGGLYRGLLDTVTEKVKVERLTGEVPDNFYTVKYTLLGVDRDRKMMVHKYLEKPTGDYEKSTEVSVLVFGGDNALIRSVGEKTFDSFSNSKPDVWKPIYDDRGVANYVAYVRTHDTKSSCQDFIDIFHALDTSGSRDRGHHIISKDDYHKTNNRIIFTRQFGDLVHVCTGAIWTYVYEGGYGYYREKTNTFTLDTVSGELTRTISGLGFGNDGEYGRTSSNYAAIHTDDNATAQINGSKTVILKWKQNGDQILSRYIDKYCSGEGDKRFVAIWDDNNKLTEGPLTAGALSAGKVHAIWQPEQALSETIVEQKFSENVLTVKAENEGEGGSFYRDFVIESGKEYFYEYDWKRKEDGGKSENLYLNMETKPLIKQVLNSDDLGEEKYYVAEAIMENFDGAATDPFFQLNPSKVKKGRYWASYPGAKGGTKNERRADTDVIKFTIPKGKKAILSFDYDMKLYGGWKDQWTNNYLELNGKHWSIYQNSDRMKGTYTFDGFLPEGENELSFRCAYYGNKSTSPYLIIDNLTVSYLDREEAHEPDEAETVHSPGQGGWMKAQGSFSAPKAVHLYQSMPAISFKGTFDQAKQQGYIVRTEPNHPPGVDPYLYKIRIPEGKIAARTGLMTSLWSRYAGYSPYFAYGDYTWTLYNPRDSSINSSVAYNISPRYSGGSNISSLFDLWLPMNLSGEQRVRGKFHKTSRETNSRVDVTGMELLLVDEPNELLDEDRYFIDDEGVLYLESSRYSGKTRLTFNIPEGEDLYYIKNFRIYTWVGGIKAYVYAEEFSDESSLRLWESEKVSASVVSKSPAHSGERQGMVYRKGELVSYDINYYDYESDPSKRSYWKYTHTPYNDGPHPQAAVIADGEGNVEELRGTVLSAPIDRFDIDGKYVLEHWQEDNTNRQGEGFPSYDKCSNVETLTFYVEGASAAPRITYIKTQPSPVKEGGAYSIIVGVDDDEKDVLRLDTELYLGNKRIQNHTQREIKAVNGLYPQIRIPASQPARLGTYEVVCTVRDHTGAGLGSLRFTVISEGKIAGMVNHTDEWDGNRKKYNMKQFGHSVEGRVDFGDYKDEKHPRKRGINVFWSGERFELSAALGGNPSSVTCQITGEGYSTSLTQTGSRNEEGDIIYKGSLWDRNMINRWGRKAPEQLTFRFTAFYSGGSIKTHDVNIIVDSKDDYWMLHRLW